jgi:ATP-binding cassette subfamily C protein
MEAVECGATALGIILEFYGRLVPLSELRHECGVSRDGSKASRIIQAARYYGLEANGYKKEIEQLQDLAPPYIVFWNLNHFVVVEGFKRQQVYINDPATGPRSVSLEEFNTAYTGIVLVMEPGAGFVRGGHKSSLLLSLWSRLQGAREAVVYCLVAGLLLNIIELVIPVFSQIFIDEIIVQGRQSWLRPLLLAMTIATVFQGGITLLQLRYLRRLKIKLSIGMSSQYLWHILRLPVSFYQHRFAGEITDRLKLNDRVADTLSGQLATTAIDLVTIGFYAIVMIQYDLLLTIIAVAIAFSKIAFLQWISRQRKDANQRLIQDYGKAAGVSISALQSIETIKASGLETNFFARWSGYYTKAINSQQDLAVTNQVLGVLPTFLSALASTLLLLVGGFRIVDGHLSIGMLVAFQSMMQSFQQPVDNLVQFGSTLQELYGDLIRLDDVLENPIEQKVAADNSDRYSFSPVLTTPKLKGEIRLRNVTFGYSHLEAPLIDNFSLLVKPGQRVALVGGSGSGKSTIAKLVSGLYQPWSGEILFDGQLPQQIPNRLLTNSIATIEQDIMLFGGTVRDNLTLWDDTISDRKLKQACQDAAIDDVIESMTGGYNATLAEGGVNLSGGQRQRLEIARALVNDPSILIADEAFSALDVETEKLIDRNLRRRGCTYLIVAHRLNTIRECDRIIVLNGGKIAEQGTHEELWQSKGIYYRLIQSEAEFVN